MNPPDDVNVRLWRGPAPTFCSKGAWWLGFRSSADPASTRDQRGAVAVEFALIMPILCLLVFGIIEFGYMLNRDMIVGNASRDGARAASLGGIVDRHLQHGQGRDVRAGHPGARCLASPTNCAAASSPTTIRISCKKPDGTACNATSANYDTVAVSGSTAIVNVSYDHTLITPFISSLLGDVVTLHQNTQMRVE